MKKRVLVLLIIILLCLFLFLQSDSEKKTNSDIKTIAFISLSKVDDNTFSGFKEQMKKYGWNSSNIKYIFPGAANKKENLAPIIKSVIKENPDLILVSSTPATQEVKKLTLNSGIPIVFCPVNDPVSSNIVENTQNPEGNITGIRLPIGDSKRFEWLYKIIPNVKRVIVPISQNDGSSKSSLKDIKEVAELLNIKVEEKTFSEDMTVEDFFKLYSENFDAIFLPRDSRVEVKIKEFAQYAIDKKIPLSAPSYQQVQKGALFTFGFIHTELGKDAARMADRILKGINPSDLPVKFGNAYLVINELTARKIGIEFPQSAIRNAKIIIK